MKIKEEKKEFFKGKSGKIITGQELENKIKRIIKLEINKILELDIEIVEDFTEEVLINVLALINLGEDEETISTIEEISNIIEEKIGEDKSINELVEDDKEVLLDKSKIIKVRKSKKKSSYVHVNKKSIKDKYGYEKLFKKAKEFFLENGLENRLDLFSPENKKILNKKIGIKIFRSFTVLASEITKMRYPGDLTTIKLNLLADKMGFRSMKEEILELFKKEGITKKDEFYSFLQDNCDNDYQQFSNHDFYKGITGEKLIKLSGKRIQIVNKANCDYFADYLF